MARANILAEEVLLLGAATSSLELLEGLVQAEDDRCGPEGFYMFSRGNIYALATPTGTE